jgi:hypothetical protein
MPYPYNSSETVRAMEARTEQARLYGADRARRTGLVAPGEILLAANSDPLDHLTLQVLVRPASYYPGPVAPWEIVGTFASPDDAMAVFDRWARNDDYDVACVELDGQYILAQAVR